MVWYLYSGISCGTQPYRLTFQENPDADGEVVGWYEGTYSSTRFTAGDQAAFQQYVFYTESENAVSSVGISRSDYVVMKYLRKKVAEQNNRLSNECTAIVTGMDGDEKKTASKASYTYESVSFEYQGDQLSVTKYGGARYGGINEMEAGMDTGTDSSFSIMVSHRGYGLTADGTTAYTTCLEDKQLYIRGEKLTTDDYSFTKFYLSSLNEYGYKIDDERGFVRDLNEDYDLYQPVEVYIRTKDEPEWQQWGTLRKTGFITYSWTDMNGNSRVQNESYPVTLPSGIWDISFRHTGTQYEVYYRVDLYVQLHPSEHILELIKNRVRDDLAWLYNVCNGYSTDLQGTICTEGISSYIPSELRDEISKADEEEYGMIVGHDYNMVSYTKWRPKSFIGKYGGSSTSDPISGQETVRYSLCQYDFLRLTTEDQKKTALDLGVFKEHRDGIFYDLLPAGTSVDVNSVRAYLYHPGYSGEGFGGLCPCSLTFEENWRDSGRTMMMIHVTAPKDRENIFSSDSAGYRNMCSGFKVYFNLIDTWENIHDYGSTIRNSMAYYSNDGNLAGGRADDGGSFTDREWFIDLDSDGNLDQNKKNVMYADDTMTFTSVTASELKFRKAVKAPQDSRYEMKTETTASGEYTYQLRSDNGIGVNAKNVVIYDVLETAWQNTPAHWQGTFRSINTTQLQNKGIDVKVYYSTDPSIGKITTGSPYADLGNTDIWSLTPPDDLSKVKAIAVDLSKKADGSDYVFAPEEVALCYVTMTAPVDVEAYIDDPNTGADETVYAYNSAYLHATSFPAAGGAESTAIEECARTQVSVRDIDVEIHKKSDPVSGSETAPALVEVESSILYTIDATNNETADAIKDVIIEDEIPEGLSIDTENIRCYFGDDASNAEPVSGSTRVKLIAEGRKLTFVVDELAGMETIHLLIPTTVEQRAAAGMIFDNTAQITGFNNKKKMLESETTWHRTDPETVDITVNKVWDDHENAYQTRPDSIVVQLYADGAAVEGKTAELNNGNNWNYKFTDLDRFQQNGETEIRYTIQETTVLGNYTPSYSGDGKTVTNILNSSSGNVGTSIKVLKYRSGTEIPVAGAKFQLKDKQGQIVETAATGTDGVAAFALTPPADTTVYELMLEEVSAPSGYAASEETWLVKFLRGDTPVTTWNSDKQVLESIWTWKTETFQNGENCKAYQNGTLTVYNDYAASTQFRLTAGKQLTGRSQKTGEFNFVVKDEDQKQVAQGSNNADGSIVFSDIFYTMADVGTHVYTIEEVQGTLPFVSYDSATFTVSVEVADNGDGTLTATAQYPENGITFNNIYSPPGGGDSPSPGGGDSPSPVNKLIEDIPQTGDETNLTLWLALLGVSVIGIIAAFLVKGKRHEKKIKQPGYGDSSS